jgi:hypothetical protein
MVTVAVFVPVLAGSNLIWNVVLPVVAETGELG